MTLSPRQPQGRVDDFTAVTRFHSQIRALESNDRRRGNDSLDDLFSTLKFEGEQIYIEYLFYVFSDFVFTYLYSNAKNAGDICAVSPRNVRARVLYVRIVLNSMLKFKIPSGLEN